MILYRAVMTLAAPLVAVFFLWRLLTGTERRSDLAERLALPATPPLPQGRAIWIHAASNGEITAARPLIAGLQRKFPGQTYLITTNTHTARDMVRGWALPNATVQLAPLDYRPVLRRVQRAFRPSALIVIENELWPNRLHMVLDDGAAVALIGARISARSARRWRRARVLLRPLLSRVALAVPQDGVSSAAMEDLGVPASALSAPVSLKSSVVLAVPPAEKVDQLGYRRSDTVLAASTHAGEEEQVLRAFQRAREQRPNLRLILAPRHPKRGAEVAKLVAATGLPSAIRSAKEPPDGAAIYLADTLGEMALWYSAAGICFVGGSLVDKGGHTPFEPAQFACALLTGPHVENAAAAFDTLRAAHAVQVVETEAQLADALVTLSPQAQLSSGQKAQQALEQTNVDALVEQVSRAIGLAAEAPPTSPT